MSHLPLAILRTTSLLVPRELRPEWLSEWRSELSYLGASGPGVRFCLGALPDALWIRRNAPRTPARRFVRLNSPVQCLLFLVSMAALSLFLAFHLPLARNLLVPVPYPNAARLFIVSHTCHMDERALTVPIQDYRLIATRMSAAFYGPAAAHVSGSKVSVALASRNLFPMLGVPVPASGPALVVRRAVWRRFGGHMPPVDGRQLPVAAILPDEFWRLPGKTDAWLIETDENLAAIPPLTKGFVVGYATVRHANWGWDLFLSDPAGSSRHFECSSLVRSQPFWANLLILGIALLLLPVVASLHSGDYPQGTSSPRRWIFLLSKIILLLPIVFFGTLDFAAATSLGFLPHGALIGYIVAFRWALNDQRRRCPVCLRLLTNPMRVGRPSQTFLAWWGTELMCGQGHGLLHVPEIPSSSSSSQRWLTLEQSWSSLFPASR